MLEGVLLVVAGLGAGLTGSVAGLASIVSYPALLATGLSPLSANVTNRVALVFSTVGSVSASRPELRGRLPDVSRLALAGALGGGLGCALLLAAPAHTFEVVVPWLIGLASLAALLRPREAHPDRRAMRLTVPAVFVIGIYGGYFGAAAGVMMLALLAHRFATLPVANAVKNLVLGCANAVAAVVFAVSAPVRWPAAVFLAVGLLAGGLLGPRIVRAANPTALRIVIAAAGLALAVTLGVRG